MWKGYNPPTMTDEHLQNAFRSLKQRTYRDGNHAVFLRNLDVLMSLQTEMVKRGVKVPQAEFKTGWLWTQITPEGDSIYDEDEYEGWR